MKTKEYTVEIWKGKDSGIGEFVESARVDAVSPCAALEAYIDSYGLIPDYYALVICGNGYTFNFDVE